MKKKLCLMVSFILILCIGIIPSTKTVFAKTNTDDLGVKAYCLMDYNTGKILASENSTEKLEVASMVKLMTSLLTMEKIESGEWDLNTKLNVSEYAASMEGSQAFLDAGYEYSLEDLLKSVIVASANDSSVVLAENYAGSENNFVEIMNKRAKELNMNNTLYGNSTGLPALNQYSCAEDIAIILKEVSKHDLYHKYATIWMDKLIHASGRETELVNTNRLIKYYPGCECGKTGFTDEAGYCLSATAKRNDMRLIAVVMGAKTSSDRFTSTSNLLNFGFANFKNNLIVDSTSLINTGAKVKNVSEELRGVAKKDIYVITKTGETDNKYEIKTDLVSKKFKNVKKGDVIGKIYLIDNGVVIDETDLLANADYISASYFETMHKVISNWSI